MENNDIALGLRHLVEHEITSGGITTDNEVVPILASLGLLSCERGSGPDELGLGFEIGLEILTGLGRTGTSSVETQDALSIVDALSGSIEHDEIAQAVRTGLLRSGANVPGGAKDRILWKQGPDGTITVNCPVSIGTIEPPTGWHERRCLRAAAYLAGAADGAYRAAVLQARERHVGGQPLLSRQLIADRLVRTLAEVRMAWCACRAAAHLHDTGSIDPEASLGALRLASAAAQRATRSFIQISGARGLTNLSPAWSWHRLVQKEIERTGGWT